MKARGWLWILAAALAVAAFAAPFACSWPDGLERVAERLGFGARGQGIARLPAPMPEYKLPGVAHPRLATALAGVVGSLLVFVLVWGLGRVLAAGRSVLMPRPSNRLRAALAGLHPAGKLVACLALVLAALALPRTQVGRLGWPAAGLLVLWVAAAIPLRLLARRLVLVAPFVVLAALSLPFLAPAHAHALAHWGPLTVTREGLLAVQAVLAKAFFCVLALSLLGAVTAPHDLLAALRALRVPGLLVTILSLTIRYLALLQEEAGRMMHARDARGTPPSLRRRARVAGWMIGSLFLRSWERAERVGQALIARGFTGTLPVLAREPHPLPLLPRYAREEGVPRGGRGTGRGGRGTSPRPTAGPLPSPVATGDSRPATVSLRSLSFAYPDGQAALSAVSFDVAAGETVALIGPNGAGKSTLLLHLNGILRGSGSVEVCGVALGDQTLREIRRLVGLVFEDPNDQLFMPTVFDDVAFGALNQALPEAEARTRAEAALEAVGMTAGADRPPHHLSLGQRKRVALATVLVMDCRILALDDPTGGLDPAGREDFLALLNCLPQTKIIATHDLEMVWDLCQRAVLMDQGQVITVGRAPEVLREERLLRAHGLRLPPQACR